MDETEYIEKRLQNQISWYSQQSKKCQRMYKGLKGISYAMALLIVPLSYWSDAVWWFKYASVAAGILIAIFDFSQSMNKYHENWIQYRTTAELLKHEKFLYLTHSGGYKNSSIAFRDLVERCESIISSENVDWAQLHKSCPAKKL